MSIVKFNDTAYIDDKKFIPYRNENLCVGSINNNNNSSVLNFSLEKININTIDSIFFYIYLQNINSYSYEDADLNLLIKKKLYGKYQTISNTSISIPARTRRKYIKIDLKSLIDMDDNKNFEYQIVIQTEKENLMILFSSNYSKNPPYVEASMMRQLEIENKALIKNIDEIKIDKNIEILEKLIKENIVKTEKLKDILNDIDKRLCNLEKEQKESSELKKDIEDLSQKFDSIMIEPLE